MDQQLMTQVRTAAGMQRIRQQLALPGRLTAGVSEMLSFENWMAERRGWCRTCRAEDVSGNHKRYGHAVVR